MVFTRVVLLLQLWVSLASASHYYGGAATHKTIPVGNGHFIVHVRNKATFRFCAYQYGTCRQYGTCGHNTRIQSGVIDWSPNSATHGHWCQTETVVTKYLTTDRPFATREYSCCWINLQYGSTWWRVTVKFDLGTRSDTNAPNNSPDIAIMPFLRVPQNCKRSYRAFYADLEDDVVRCRYGNYYDEECYGCRRQIGFQLNEAACTLNYLGEGNRGVHGFELVAEDFPRQDVRLSYSDGSSSQRYGIFAERTAPSNTNMTSALSNTTMTPVPTPSSPFSLLPLQFVFEVDPPVSSCTEGLYLPMFVYPTPPNGQTMVAEVGKELEIRVKAEALYSVVDDIIMTGPLNIAKHRTTGDVFTITWTPTQENFGYFFVICFVVEFKSGSSIYQTEMRCVIVHVEKGPINTVVTCKENMMIVEVEKATLPRIHHDELRLSESSDRLCNLLSLSNSTHVVGEVPLNRCGTQIEEDNEYLIFKNEITTVDSSSALITRKHQVEIHFKCKYTKTGNVTTSFSAHRENVRVWDVAFGHLTYGFEFFPTEFFDSMIEPRFYPLMYDVGDRIYMEIDATTTVDNTELFVESCEASPYDNPSYTNTYTIIADGCNIDSTIKMYPVSNKRQFKFSLEAFRFIGDYDQVYISCTVMMCVTGDPNTRCSQGCQPNAVRRKREAAIESGSHYVSQGPLRLKRSVEAAGNTGLNLNVVFIAGCVLAALGMICGVIFFKAKKTTIKYHRLPSEEN